MAVAYASHASTAWADLDGQPRQVVITKPASLAAGDLLVAVIATSGDDSSDVSSSGFTRIAKLDNSNDGALQVLTKDATSGDAAASNFTFTVLGGGTGNTGQCAAGTLYRITGATAAGVQFDTDIDGDIDAAKSFGNITLTPQQSDHLLIANVCATVTSGVTFSSYAVATDNPTWTERADALTTVGTDYAYATATGPRSSSSATGIFTVTASGNASCITVLVLINATTSITVTPAVISNTLSVVAPSVTGSAAVTPTVITATASIQAPTVTIAAPDWTNADKSNTPSWSNPDKS